MSRVHLNLDIDMSNEGQLTAVSNFFKALADAAPATRQAELDNITDTPGAVIARREWEAGVKEPFKDMEVVDPEEVPGKPLAPEETKEESPSSEETEESSPKSEDTPGPEKKKRPSTIKKKATSKQESDKPSSKPSTEAPQDLREPLRVLLAEKVDDHRATIKAELGKYNAKGISNLAVEHHAAFMHFMENLS